MNIDLKLTVDQISYLNLLFDEFRNLEIQSIVHQKRDRKLILSICIDVADRLSSKFESLSKKQTLFDAKKTHKISFKYHEAYAVNTYLNGAKNKEIDPYKLSMAIILLTKIDPKLS